MKNHLFLLAILTLSFAEKIDAATKYNQQSRSQVGSKIRLVKLPNSNIFVPEAIMLDVFSKLSKLLENNHEAFIWFINECKNNFNINFNYPIDSQTTNEKIDKAIKEKVKEIGISTFIDQLLDLELINIDQFCIEIPFTIKAITNEVIIEEKNSITLSLPPF